jgi:hypothetical protein
LLLKDSPIALGLPFTFSYKCYFSSSFLGFLESAINFAKVIKAFYTFSPVLAEVSRNLILLARAKFSPH